MSRRKLKSEDVVPIECDNLLRIAENVAKELDINVELAVLTLILRELVILNRQMRSKAEE